MSLQTPPDIYLAILLPQEITATGSDAITSILESLPAPVASALELGGPVSALLVLLSLISLAVIIFKTCEISLESMRDKGKIRQSLRLWQQARYRDAANKVGDSQVGVGRILWVAMQGRQTDDIVESTLREEIQRLASRHIERLRRYLKLLENIGTISPLLGLFGTVLGMIEAFRQMESAGSQVDPAVLSGGIWQALLTTGVGLAVAIPTVLAHQWLERRVDSHVHYLEDVTTQVFTANTLKRIESPQPAKGAGVVNSNAT